jgi:hypothetical protein
MAHVAVGDCSRSLLDRRLRSALSRVLGRQQDCQAWVTSHGYQLVQNDWWAKSRGCAARTPSGDEILHSEGLGSRATGWAWQFVIFAVGALPAGGMIVLVSRRSGGTGA